MKETVDETVDGTICPHGRSLRSLVTGERFTPSCGCRPREVPRLFQDPMTALMALRNAGWSVAVHNDYKLDGVPMTFWLFTHPNGMWLKGEGQTDAEVLNEIAASTARESRPPSGERPWMCDACGGEGRALSGPCMCGGTGLAVDAVCHLRDELFKTEERCTKLEEVLRGLLETVVPQVHRHCDPEVCTCGERVEAALAALKAGKTRDSA